MDLKEHGDSETRFAAYVKGLAGVIGAGASSATIRSSSRKSGSGTMKGAGGAASIITSRCALRLTDS